jgi:hypothetical protein
MFSLKVTSLLETILWLFIRICLFIFVLGFIEVVLDLFPGYYDIPAAPGLRAALLMRFAWFLTSLVLLYKLVAIVETIGKGDPFTAVNVSRLRWIAWAVFVGEGLRGGMAWVDYRDVSGDLLLLPVENIGPSAWSLVVVLVLFALARVFEEGTRMREEIGEMI